MNHMLTKTIRRRLAVTAKPTTLLAYPVDREHPNNVLNTNPVSVSAHIAREYKRYTLTNTDTRIRVNRLLESVFLGDAPGAANVLARLREKCLVNRVADSYPRNLEVYLSCLVMMVMHFCQSLIGLENKGLRAVIDAVEKIPNHIVSGQDDRVREIRQLLVVLMLKTLSGMEKKSSAYALLVTEARVLSEKWKVDESTVGQLVLSKYLQLVPQYNVVWRKSSPQNTSPPKQEPREPAADSFLNEDGTMSYRGLCEFIARSRFDTSAYCSDPHAKMHDVYHKLSETEKKAFMSEYLEFNKKRQLIVEQFCGDLHESLHSSDAKSLSLFGSTNKRWIRQWHGLICAGLKDHAKEGGLLAQYSSFLSVVPTETFASSVLSTILAETLPLGETTLVSLTSRLSYTFNTMIKRNKKLSSLTKQLNLFLNDEASVQFFSAVTKVVIDNCKMPDEDPVFSFGYSQFSHHSPKYKKSGVVKINSLVARQFETCLELFLTNSYLFPMLHPPKKWLSPTSGGFLEDLTPLVKSTDKDSTSYFMNMAHRTGQLNSVYDSLNALGSIPWAIEPNMLNAFNEAMEYEEGFNHIPPKIKNGPAQLVKQPQVADFTSEDDYKKALYQFKTDEAEARKTRNEQHSLRVYYELANVLANSLGANGDAIYYPHNLDFRGRVYPCTSFLSHHNEDLMRALLTFWEAKPLGPNGYDWLRYQLANIYLGTSVSIEELKDFVEKNRSAILESAASPMASESWWKKGDSPWQSLAMCMELKKVWEFSGKVEDYCSRMPIHMDGTCNGLQHYAALGADTEAAASVNLMPGDTKNDVYITVLNRVKKKVQQDVNSGDDDVSNLAKQVYPLLSRKVVKQTVMTTVYGVTLYGAFRQIRGKLDEALNGDGKYNPETAKMATYIAKYVLEAISDLFSGARKIQNWLLENCGRCISAYDKHTYPQKQVDFFAKKKYRPMMWTSLSGLPVIQPYRKNTTKEISTVLQKVSLQHKGKLTHIDVHKQLNGIAPNFIHLLDAIHLLMTCLASQQAGIAFVAVHDSFWTHPGDVETLSRLIRQEFVRLHKSEIITNLRLDLKHMNQNAYQVVWVESNSDFAERLRELRHTYNCGIKNTPAVLNRYLNIEFGDNSKVERLVELHQPQLLYEDAPYSTKNHTADMSHQKQSKISSKTHTPLLVPVKILEEPELGNLDIDIVLASKYFFS